MLKYGKKFNFGHFSVPWAAPLYLKSQFFFTYIGDNMYAYSLRVFNYYIEQLNKYIFFAKILKKKKYFQPLYQANSCEFQPILHIYNSIFAKLRILAHLKLWYVILGMSAIRNFIVLFLPILAIFLCSFFSYQAYKKFFRGIPTFYVCKPNQFFRQGDQ